MKNHTCMSANWPNGLWKYLTNQYHSQKDSNQCTYPWETIKYSVSDYFKHIPTNIFNDTSFQTVYFNKHTSAHPNLTLNNVESSYEVLKCNLEVEDQDEYNVHCRFVHGLIASDLRKEQTIKIDAKATFKLDPALNAENVGADLHRNILNGWFTKGVATAVI